MGRGGKHKTRPGGKVRVRKVPAKNQSATNTPQANAPVKISDMKVIYNKIMEDVGRMLKDFELRQKTMLSRLTEEYQTLKTNVIITQTILGEQKIINDEEFMEKVKDYLQNVIGEVDQYGRMSGFVQVDTYRIGVAQVHPTIAKECIGRNPKIIVR